jgi:hypothetical protein
MQVSGHYFGLEGLREVLKLREATGHPLPPNVRPGVAAMCSRGKCQHCGLKLPPGRKDMKYCDSTCQRNARRLRKAQEGRR